MFDDFEDPFGLPMEALDLAAPAKAEAPKQRGPAYSPEEVQKLAGFGEAGGVLRSASYALRTRKRVDELGSDLARKRSALDASVGTCDEELRLLAAKLVANGTLDEAAAGNMDSVLEVLRSGKAGAILAAPSLGAFTDARAASRETALVASALNAVEDGAYRRGSELFALVATLAIVGLGLALLL